MSKQEILERLRGRSDELSQRFGVKELLLFGSIARGEVSDDSDADMLVEFDGRATFDRFMGLRFHLEDLLGVRVDLVTRKALRPRMRPGIEREAIHVA
jgi:predicted nucleotidyltransferase